MDTRTLLSRSLKLSALTITAAALSGLTGCSSSPPPRRPVTTTAATPAAEQTTAILTGPAEYGVVSRELAALEQAPIDRVYVATQDALRELELRLVEKTKDRLSATVGARTSHDDRVTVSLGRVTGGVTDVKIKVGFWGDESTSRAILTEIRKKLAEPAPKAVTPEAPANNPALLDDPGVLAAAPKPAPVKPKAPVTTSPAIKK